MKRAALYFFAGAVMDYLVTQYYLAVDSRALFSASSLAALITLFSMFVISGITDVHDDRRGRALLILSYAVGNGVGTALAMSL